MTAYLAHRLARAGVRSLARVWIVDPERAWFVEDISDELAILFPGVEVSLSAPSVREPDLAVIPFFNDECNPRARRRLLRKAARFEPAFIGLYELGKRRLVVIPRGALRSYLLRITAEAWLRYAARVPQGLVGRFRRVSAGNGEQR